MYYLVYIKVFFNMEKLFFLIWPRGYVPSVSSSSEGLNYCIDLTTDEHIQMYVNWSMQVHECKNAHRYNLNIFTNGKSIPSLQV